MTLLVLVFLIGIGIPTVVALAASWREAAVRPLRVVRRAPRARLAATVLIYHTDNEATAMSLRALRRLRAVRLAIVIVIPADIPLGINVPPNIIVHRKQRPASRALTLASCYRHVDPANPLCVLDSGDIMTATTLYTALCAFHRTDVSAIAYRRTNPPSMSFTGTMQWFINAADHVRAMLSPIRTSQLPAGTWLRHGSQLRTNVNIRSHYAPYVTINSTRSFDLRPLRTGTAIGAFTIVAIATPCYVAAAQLHASLPLISFWILSAWWLNILISLTPGKATDKVLPAISAPLGGILLPTWCGIFIGNTLRRAWQRLARTRRQHTDHRILFRLRHP